jgi:hypothetical protein
MLKRKAPSDGLNRVTGRLNPHKQQLLKRTALAAEQRPEKGPPKAQKRRRIPEGNADLEEAAAKRTKLGGWDFKKMAPDSAVLVIGRVYLLPLQLVQGIGPFHRPVPQLEGLSQSLYKLLGALLRAEDFDLLIILPWLPCHIPNIDLVSLV